MKKRRKCLLLMTKIMKVALKMNMLRVLNYQLKNYLRYNKFLKQSLSPSSVHGKINRWKNQVVWKKQPYQLSKRMKLKCTEGHVWIWRDLWRKVLWLFRQERAFRLVLISWHAMDEIWMWRRFWVVLEYIYLIKKKN